MRPDTGAQWSAAISRRSHNGFSTPRRRGQLMRHQDKTIRDLKAQILAITAWIINSLPATEQWSPTLELITAFGVALGTIMPMELALAASATSLLASLRMIQASRYRLRQCCIQASETFETCYTFLDHIATISGGLGYPLPTPGLLLLAAALAVVTTFWRNRW